MHERSNFPLLWLFLSFEMDFSALRPLSDKISYRIRATPGVSSLTTLVTRQSKTTTQLIMHLGNIECRLEGFRLKQRSQNFLDAGPNSRSYQRPWTELFCVSKTKKNTTRITPVTFVFFYLFSLLVICLQCDLWHYFVCYITAVG